MTEGRAMAPEEGLMLLMGGTQARGVGAGEKKRKKKDEGAAVPKKSKQVCCPAPAGPGLEKNNGFLKPFSSIDVTFQDAMTARNDKDTPGIARVAFGAFSGRWFYEVEVLSAQANKDSVRVGCTTDQGSLNCALGDSQNGYGYCSSDGGLTHNSDTSEILSQFSTGDVIGCLLDFGHLDFTGGNDKESFSGSSIQFFKNGILQEGGFKNLLKGTYYPAVSLGSGGVVRVNPGPDFKFAPDNVTATAISQLVPIHLRNSEDGHLKQKPRLKKAVVDGGDSQSHYNQCCHHCRAKPRPGLGVLRCSYHPCTRIFCLRCIRKYYSTHGDEGELRSLSDSGKWICLCCTNSCICKACQRVRFRKQENNLVAGGKPKLGKKEGEFKKGQSVAWAPTGEVALETYDMEAALGLATLFSIRNAQKGPTPTSLSNLSTLKKPCH